MNTSEIVYLGVHGHVVATNKNDGRVLWRTKLRGGGFLSSSASFVTILVDGDRIYAHTVGELYCIDAVSGQAIWKNELDGLGYDIASLAIQGTSAPSPAMMARIQQQRSDASSSATSSNT